MFQHLGGLSQALNSSGLISIKLGCWNFHSLLQCFREHSSPDTLRTSLVQLRIHI